MHLEAVGRTSVWFFGIQCSLEETCNNTAVFTATGNNSNIIIIFTKCLFSKKHKNYNLTNYEEMLSTHK